MSDLANQFLRHSGAMRSIESGISIVESNLGIPDPARCAVPE
jgi:hypothetical protein